MAFDTAFAGITSRKSHSEGGSRFYDKSALYHAQGEYKFTPAFMDIHRWKLPLVSSVIGWNHFSDTADVGSPIRVWGLLPVSKGIGEKLKLQPDSAFRQEREFRRALFTGSFGGLYHELTRSFLRIVFLRYPESHTR